mmetsp:Transcript_6910/g.17334  ORF Transcript_6910/g.17334 Transcript_6910/m.17334 type:complete len:162 (-) Transcript_6910:392-877(-)
MPTNSSHPRTWQTISLSSRSFTKSPSRADPSNPSSKESPLRPRITNNTRAATFCDRRLPITSPPHPICKMFDKNNTANTTTNTTTNTANTAKPTRQDFMNETRLYLLSNSYGGEIWDEEKRYRKHTEQTVRRFPTKKNSYHCGNDPEPIGCRNASHLSPSR